MAVLLAGPPSPVTSWLLIALKASLSRAKQNLWHWRGVLIAVPSVTAAVLGLRSLGLLQQPELLAYDQFFLLRPREAVDSRIVIVEINEADVQRQKRWPMSDAVLAQLLLKIRSQKPAVIGLDLYRELEEEPGHAQLLEVFKTTPNLIGVQKVGRSADSSPVPPPPQLAAQEQNSANDLILDGDGKIRRGLFYITDEQGNNLASFGAAIALLYLQPKGVQFQFSETEAQVGAVKFPALQANDGGYVRAGMGGFQILLNYRGTIEQFQRVSMTEVLEKPLPPDLMRDRIVLIGSTAESLKDLFYDPYSSNLTAPRRTPGVVIHANLASQIISAALDNRPILRTWSEPAEWTWIVFCALIGAVMSWQQRYLKQPWNLLGLLGTLAAIGGVIGISFAAFLNGWWIPVVPPVLAMAGSALAITGYIARSASDMRRTFGRYLTDEVVASLLETPSGQRLGGERRKVTVLIADLRGFSAVSEYLPPEQVVNVLNLFLGTMSDVVTHYQGNINEFLGDGIFVMFGAPIYRPDDSQRAVACAIAMQNAMAAVNDRNRQLGMPLLEMGIGIHTGEVIVGNIGSQRRAKYTVIGRHVNLAARIESYTVGRQILISESTYQDAGAASIQVEGQMRVEPKGIKEPITLFDVRGIGGRYKVSLPEEVESFVTLAQPVPIHYTVLEGKHSVGTVFEGQIVRMSEFGAEVRSRQLPMPLSNLKLAVLTTGTTIEIEDLYGKVLQRKAECEGCFRIRFTGVLPDAAAMLEQIRRGEAFQK